MKFTVNRNNIWIWALSIPVAAAFDVILSPSLSQPLSMVFGVLLAIYYPVVEVKNK